MSDTLMKFQTCEKFDTGNSEKSVNNLYNIYYEMLEKSINEDINIFDKAKELDDYYKEINVKEPENFYDDSLQNFSKKN